MTRLMNLQGRLAECVLVTYRTPYDSVAHLVPEGLELVRRGDFAFWSIVCCRVEHMRPAGMPAIPLASLSYNLVGYRLMVQAMTERAEVIDGLYFLRSDAESRVVGALGNRLTDFNFCPAEIELKHDDNHASFRVTATPHGEMDAELAVTHMPAALLAGSCFPTVEDARAFCRYSPRGLSVEDDSRARWLKIAQVRRDGRSWCETPVAIERARWGYLETLGQAELIQPEWAVRVMPVEYRWELGRREALLGRVKRSQAPRPVVRAADSMVRV